MLVSAQYGSDRGKSVESLPGVNCSWVFWAPLSGTAEASAGDDRRKMGRAMRGTYFVKRRSA
jgi:hypothetical protein